MYYSKRNTLFKLFPPSFLFHPLLLSLGLFITMLALAPSAAALDVPTGRVILKVTGNISATNVGGSGTFRS